MDGEINSSGNKITTPKFLAHFKIQENITKLISSLFFFFTDVESVDLEISQESPSKQTQPIEVIFERNFRHSASILSKSRSEHKLGGRSSGIWQRCHDSDNTRMPWSMANR